MNGALIVLGPILFVLAGMLLAAISDMAEDRWLERKGADGWLPGFIKATSGSQPGFPRHWRRVMARVSPWRLDCRGSYLRFWSGSIDVTAEPRCRNPSRTEFLRLTNHQHGLWSVIELETATATLKWAVPSRRLDWAVSKIRGTPSGDAGYDGVHVRR